MCDDDSNDNNDVCVTIGNETHNTYFKLVLHWEGFVLPSLCRSASGKHEDIVREYVLLYLKNKAQSYLNHNNQKY